MRCPFYLCQLEARFCFVLFPPLINFFLAQALGVALILPILCLGKCWWFLVRAVSIAMFLRLLMFSCKLLLFLAVLCCSFFLFLQNLETWEAEDKETTAAVVVVVVVAAAAVMVVVVVVVVGGGGSGGGDDGGGGGCGGEASVVVKSFLMHVLRFDRQAFGTISFFLRRRCTALSLFRLYHFWLCFCVAHCVPSHLIFPAQSLCGCF